MKSKNNSVSDLGNSPFEAMITSSSNFMGFDSESIYNWIAFETAGMQSISQPGLDALIDDASRRFHIDRNVLKPCVMESLWKNNVRIAGCADKNSSEHELAKTLLSLAKSLLSDSEE